MFSERANLWLLTEQDDHSARSDEQDKRFSNLLTTTDTSGSDHTEQVMNQKQPKILLRTDVPSHRVTSLQGRNPEHSDYHNSVEDKTATQQRDSTSNLLSSRTEPLNSMSTNQLNHQDVGIFGRRANSPFTQGRSNLFAEKSLTTLSDLTQTDSALFNT